MRVAVFMMMKNEALLFKPWVRYHEWLFGKQNLYIWDNGTTDPDLLLELHQYRADGYNISFDRHTAGDYRNKALIMGAQIKKFDQGAEYDFHIPIDCDEFFMLEQGGAPTFDRDAILASLAGLLEAPGSLVMRTAYYNVLGHANHYWRYADRSKTQAKCFFARNQFIAMGHGYHKADTRSGGTRDTDFGYMHFHHRPAHVVAAHARNKVVAFIDPKDEVSMTANAGNRLVRQMFDSPERYLQRFRIDDDEWRAYGRVVPQFEQALARLGSTLPF
jgi:hypothetical protein